MVKIQNSSRLFWIAFLFITVLVSILAFYQAQPQFISQNIAPWRSKWTLILLSLLFNIFIGSYVAWGLMRGSFGTLLDRIEFTSLSTLQLVSAWIFVLVPPALFWLIRFKIFGAILPQLFPALWVLLWLSLISAIALNAITKSSLAVSFIALLLFQGVLFRLWDILGVVTDFPFTLEYSETSRFYYASLPFSQSIYNVQLPLSTLHPSRYFLQALAFLIPGLPLWAHRLWQALLWIILTGTSAGLLARRMKLPSKYLTVIVTAWGFVYFLQGAVYYHLQVCVIIILLGFSAKHPLRTLLTVILASLWAGISRINWFPVPAMLAIALFLLEEPITSYKNIWHYLKHPIIWAIAGVFSALLSQAVYVFQSGNSGNASDFGSSFTSDLIWNRLLPNATYPLGVLPGIIIISTPLCLLLFHSLSTHDTNWHFIRPFGIFSMLTVLFLGGLVVSTKIGGGADIHNMDAFMVLLAIISGSFFADQVKPDQATQWGMVPIKVLLFAAVVPITFSIQSLQSHFSYDKQQSQKDLDLLRSIVTDATSQGGEVLFISERHLLTFHMLEDVSLVPEYEVITLMEMAMAGNQTYLEQFDQDLAEHRFAVIITHRQRIVKKENESFAEENNVWVDAISRPLLCYYERDAILESSNTMILVPAEAQADCP
jgi:hypothetical protein